MSFDDLIQADIERFQTMVGIQPGADRQMILLKGHLLIEELLQAYIDSRMSDPTALSEARLTFHHRLCLSKALHPNPNRFGYSWVWDATKQLNTLRNQMVHNLTPKGFTDKLNEFVSIVEAHMSKLIIEGEGAEYEMARFSLSISVLNVCLTRLIQFESLNGSNA